MPHKSTSFDCKSNEKCPSAVGHGTLLIVKAMKSARPLSAIVQNRYPFIVLERLKANNGGNCRM